MSVAEAFHDVNNATIPALAQPVSLTGATGNSRDVRPGDIYFALPGARVHGAKFAASALDQGAAAICTDSRGAEQINAGNIPVVIHEDPRAIMGHVAAAVYGHPSRALTTLGVTGTNGKTTVSYMMDAALRHLGKSTGMIGTVETRVGDVARKSVHTTPESYDMQALLAVMVERGVTHASIEVSSHALALHRVDSIIFSVAGYTNLSQDHLDFHDGMDDYFATKAQLFTPARSKRGIIWGDDDWAGRLLDLSGVPCEVLSRDDHHGWKVANVRPGATGSEFTLTSPDGTTCEAKASLPGDFNVANAAVAIAMLHASGVSLDDAVAGVASCRGVPGRMERVSEEGEPLAIVDFAHSPESIELACATVRPLTPGRLVVVVGAGGDRDSTKRPLMGAAAAKWADIVVVTDDNPRSEDPRLIREAVAAGARKEVQGGENTLKQNVQIVECDGRSAAIREAISFLHGQGDTVLLVGKGHEQGQIVQETTLPFDDRVELREALGSLRHSASDED